MFQTKLYVEVSVVIWLCEWVLALRISFSSGTDLCENTEKEMNVNVESAELHC
jgi:hypothetical protein